MGYDTLITPAFWIIGLILTCIVADRRMFYFLFKEKKSRKGEIEIAQKRMMFSIALLLLGFLCEEPWQTCLVIVLIAYKVYYLVYVIYDNGYAIIVDNLKDKGNMSGTIMAVYNDDYIIRVNYINFRRVLREARQNGKNVRWIKLGFYSLSDEQILDMI